MLLQAQAPCEKGMADEPGHLHEAASPAHGAVAAHLAGDAVQEDRLEVEALGDRPHMVAALQEVLERRAVGGAVHAAIVLAGDPGDMPLGELGEGQRRAGQFAADLGAPCLVIALDGTLPQGHQLQAIQSLEHGVSG